MKNFAPRYAASARRCFSFLILICCLAVSSPAQSLDRIERERGKQMLNTIKGDIKKNYYDPTFRGKDLDSHFKNAEAKIDKAASIGQVLGIIAQALIDFDDSHLFFNPPPLATKVDYGWNMKMIGDECFIYAVRPGSNAAAQGVKEGDKIIALDGFKPTRREMWKVNYYYNALSPRAGLQLVLQSPDGKQRQVDVKSKVTQGRRTLNLTGSDGGIGVNDYIRELEDREYLTRHRFKDFGSVYVWNMPTFDLTEQQIDDVMSKAQGKNGIVIDLRGNGGGYETTLKRLIGHFIDREIQVAELKGRKNMKPLIAKPIGKQFTGKLIVLIDSESGSSSELFARVMQIEKRATVIGDVSAGAVMRALHYAHEMGGNTIVPYGVSVTDADAVMADGKSLEHRGVTPDELMLPKGEDMAAKRDPVLARAISLAGMRIDAAQAGALFPVEWKH